jgi:hypothetical protein
MNSEKVQTHKVSRSWKWAALVMGTLLILSWATLGFALLDGATSLEYCRVEQAHLRHDIRFLVQAAKAKVPSTAFLETRARLYPGLPKLEALEPNRTLGLETIALQFDKTGLLDDCSSVSSEAAINPCAPGDR